MNKLFVTLCVTLKIIFPSEAFAVSAEVDWEKSYKSLLVLLKQTRSVGSCKIGLFDNGVEEGFTVKVTTRSQVVRELDLDAPRLTSGVSRVTFDRTHRRFTYAVADFVGWVKLTVQYNSKHKINWIKMYKALPSGQVYNVGVTCGRSST